MGEVAPVCPSCPECTSQRVWRDGLRRTSYGEVQRWICRDCGYRFSDRSRVQIPADPPSLEASEWSRRVQTVDRQILNLPNAHTTTRRVCVADGAMVNLATVDTTQQSKQYQAAGAKLDLAAIKGLIIQFAFWLQKEGYKDIRTYPTLVFQVARLGADLKNPESVKEVIGKHKVKNGVKMMMCYAYDALTKMLNIKWDKPTYKQEEILPFIPEEQELDALIAGCRSRRMAAFLQALKETFADPGEILKARWIDLSGNILTINFPVRGHYPGQMQISSKLLAMLNALPHTSDRIFQCDYSDISQAFRNVRKRLTHNLQNPRLNAISFTTFRHWGATWTYAVTKNILLVQKLLRHKNIKNTMKYTQLVNFKSDEYDVATATTIEEAKEVLSVGFEYITEMKGVKLFRKPKIFKNLCYKTPEHAAKGFYSDIS